MLSKQELQKFEKQKENGEKDFTTPVTSYKDTPAWEIYEKIQNLPLFQNKLSKGSDGRDINIAWAPGQFKKKIEGLPSKEIETLMKKKKLYSKLFMKGLQAKRKAYVQANLKTELGGKKSILDAKRAEILELFGRMFKVKEVHKICVEDWGMNIALSTLDTYRKKNTQIINEKIEEFKRDYSDIRLSIKKSRLEELAWMYSKRKRLYESTNNRDDHKLLIQTIEQIRKEAEGDMIRVNGKIEFDQEQNIQKHLMQEAFKFLSIKQLILARVAARYGRNPLILQKSIAESYYHKYLQSPGTVDFPGYPTNDTYDFEKVIQAAQERERRNKENIIAPAVIVKDEDRVKSIKEQLIEKLSKLSGDVNVRKNNMLLTDAGTI